MFNDDEDDIPTLIDHRAPPPPPTPPEGEEKDKRVPLTIICGFLGAGKSTLLKRILTERHGYRIAVIMNEFGDTADIESKAINIPSEEEPNTSSNPNAPPESSDFLELANGCLCCSIKDSGAAAIEKLMQRKGAFDHILLETTGLADPGPIAATFWQNEEYSSGLGKDIILDGVLCVVDAVFGKAQMEEDRKGEEGEDGESVRQIAQSDIILLNKADLVSPSSLAFLEGTIRALNPTAPIHRTVRGDVDLGKIMGVGAFRGVGDLRDEAKGTKLGGERAHDHHDDDAACCAAEGKPKQTHYELRGISSLKIDIPPLTPVQLGKMDEWLRSVLWEGVVPVPGSSSALKSSGLTFAAASTSTPTDASDIAPSTEAPSTNTTTTALQILRTKGLILTTSGTRYIIQGVRSMYEMSEHPTAGDGELDGVESGKLVLIGKGLGEEVRRSLRAVFE